MNEEREIQNLIKKLGPEAAMPSLAFESRLKKRILAKNKGPLLQRMQNNFHDFWFGSQGIPANSYGFLTAGVLIVAILMAGLFIWKLNQGNTIYPQQTQLSAQESHEVLTNIYKNNPQALLATSTQGGLLAELIDNQPAAGAAAFSTAVQMQPAALAPVAIAKNYNFFHVSYTRALGPMAQACSSLATDNVRLETFTYELTDNNTVSANYFKAVEYDATDNINYISITDNTESTIYAGGQYAARLQIQATDNSITTTPAASMLPSADPLAQMFGSAAVITKLETNGKTLYRVTVSSDAAAACASGPVINEVPIIVVHTIDPEQNYQVISSAYYYGSVAAENLILQSVNNYDRTNLTPGQALTQYFTLGATLGKEIPVKDFGTATPTLAELTGVASATTASLNTLSTGHIQVLLLSDLPQEFNSYQDLSLYRSNYIKALGFNWDSNFYSPANWARNQAAITAAQADNTIVQYSQAIPNESTAMQIDFKLSLPGSSVSACSNGAATTVNIDGKSVDAQELQTQVHTVCFEYQGIHYELSITNVADYAPGQVLNLSSYNPLSSSGSTVLQSMLHAVYTQTATDPIEFSFPGPATDNTIVP